GDRERVVDVALATTARLMAVGLFGRLVGTVDHRHGRLGVPAAIGAEQWGQLVSGDVLVPPPWEYTVYSGHGETSVPREAFDEVTLQAGTAAEVFEFDQHSHTYDDTAECLDQLHGSSRGAARCQDIVDHQYPLAEMNGVAVDLELVAS